MGSNCEMTVLLIVTEIKHTNPFWCNTDAFIIRFRDDRIENLSNGRLRNLAKYTIAAAEVKFDFMLFSFV